MSCYNNYNTTQQKYPHPTSNSHFPYFSYWLFL